MLPSFAKIVAMRGHFNLMTIHKSTSEISPILGQINRHVQHEGGSSVIHRFDASSDTTQLTPVGASLRIDKVKLEEFTHEKVLSYLLSAAEQVAKGATKHIVNEMNRITEATGNVVSADGGTATEDMILESIEKMEHSFSPEGFWHPPTIFTSKESAASLLRGGANRSSEFAARLNQILVRKRDEFFSREASRVLVG